MKTLLEIQQILQAEKPFLAETYGVNELALFGSYVRGEARADSDVDILIDLAQPPRISLIDLVELEYYLSEQLGTKADVALKMNLRPRVGKHILEEMIVL